MSMLNRSIKSFNNDGTYNETFRDVEWHEVRKERNRLLLISDWRFLGDQESSQVWVDYRQFLRDLPQNYESANDAADALTEYNSPE